MIEGRACTFIVYEGFLKLCIWTSLSHDFTVLALDVGVGVLFFMKAYYGLQK